jgi:hypothetical protein
MYFANFVYQKVMAGSLPAEKIISFKDDGVAIL